MTKERSPIKGRKTRYTGCDRLESNRVPFQYGRFNEMRRHTRNWRQDKVAKREEEKKNAIYFNGRYCEILRANITRITCKTAHKCLRNSIEGSQK